MSRGCKILKILSGSQEYRAACPSHLMELHHDYFVALGRECLMMVLVAIQKTLNTGIQTHMSLQWQSGLKLIRISDAFSRLYLLDSCPQVSHVLK